MALSRRTFLVSGGLMVASGVAVLGSNYVARADTARVITPVQAFAASTAGDILLVDVRRPSEWAATGIPKGAVAIDMRRADFIDAVLAARSRPDQPIAVICMRGVRSARVTRAMEESGLTSIIDVPEGMLGSRAGPGWLERGLPVVNP